MIHLVINERRESSEEFEEMKGISTWTNFNVDKKSQTLGRSW